MLKGYEEGEDKGGGKGGDKWKKIEEFPDSG
jgi:hypothetical protein